ncbi:MAG: hypothetical protein ACOYOS_18385 [Syntrophales bacterium]
MANIANVSQSVPLVKNSYKSLLSMGEGAKGDDFRMTIEGYSDIEYLVQATQLPAIKREMIESKGPHGVMFNQAGNFMNAQDVTITFKEVITGKALEVIRDWVKEKKYLTVTIALISESAPESVTANSVVLEDAWLEIDAVDLSVDDTTSLVKPAGTIHGNWVTWADDEQETLPWE